MYVYIKHAGVHWISVGLREQYCKLQAQNIEDEMLVPEMFCDEY